MPPTFAPSLSQMPLRLGGIVSEGTAHPARRRPLNSKTVEQAPTALTWLVGLTACFLMVGLAGMLEQEEGMPALLSGLPGAGPGEAAAAGMEAMMLDVQAQQADSTTAEQPQTPETTVMDMPALPTPQEVVTELPEMEQALVAEDVFVVPAAPRVETALRPVDPPAPAPPRPAARSATQNRSSSSTARSGSPAGTAGQGGGSGGSGAAGMSAAAGKFVIPRPSYPSALKALGVSGTVRLSIQVGMSGRPESVSIVSSSGSAALDDFAASWVRRNGRGPAGSPGRVIAPLSFILR